MSNRLLSLSAFILSVFSMTPRASAYWESSHTTEVVIDSPVENVFDYLTTAKTWVDWHPATYATAGANDHSARVGEQIIETVIVPDPADYQHSQKLITVTYTVTERRTAREWQIVGSDADGIWDFEFTYEFIPQAGGRTLWRRTMFYSTQYDAVLNAQYPGYLAYLEPLVEHVSEIAVQNAKAQIESLPLPWWRPTHD